MVDYVGTLNTIIDVALWMLVGAVVLVGVFFVMRMLQYKHTVLVKVLTESGSLVVPDKAREMSEEGVKFWRLRKMRDKTPVPPDEVVQLTKKGKLFVEAVRTQQGEYVWIKPSQGSDVIEQVKEPITSNDRIFYARQEIKAAQRQTKGWKDVVEKALPYFVVVMILVLVFAFWGTITQPMKDVMSKAASIASEQHETQKLINQALQEKQSIGDELVQGDTVPD